MNDQEIFDQLKPLIADTLGVAPDTIRMESVLVSELGAESIDLLDLSFRIEETFKVTIETNEIEQEARQRLAGRPYEEKGCLTEEALVEIRKAIPEIDARKLVKGLRKTDLPSLLTVSFFVRLIRRKLNPQGQGAAHA